MKSQREGILVQTLLCFIFYSGVMMAQVENRFCHLICQASKVILAVKSLKAFLQRNKAGWLDRYITPLPIFSEIQILF